MQKHSGSSYDDKADRYADRQDVKPWNLYYERPAVLQYLPEVCGKDVLDAGCGPGYFSEQMLNRGARVSACDLNPTFVERTKQRTQNQISVAQVDLAEPLKLYASESFDLIVCILVLHYLKDWQPTLAEFHRILRPQGQLFFSTHHPCTDLELSKRGNYFATELLEDEWDVGKVTYYRRPLSKISQDLHQTGFLIEELFEPRPDQAPEARDCGWYERSMTLPMRLMVCARKTIK